MTRVRCCHRLLGATIAAIVLTGSLAIAAVGVADADVNEAATTSAPFAGLSAGGFHTCSIVGNGRVKCWGLNAYGQLGAGSTVNLGAGPNEMGNALLPVNLGPGRRASAVVAGRVHSCALLDGGAVKCWGRGENRGQLGLGQAVNRGTAAAQMGSALPPVNLGAGAVATALSSSWDHTCALLAGGEVKCWGWNESGQLGLGDTAVRGSGPGEMGSNLAPVDLGPGRTAVQISAGTNHTCALLDNGSVKCWGANNYGQLGLGDTAARGNDPGEMGAALDPVDLGAGVTATAISAGNDFTCAVLDSGDVKCWGQNDVGQLGQGDTVPRGDGPGEMGDNLDSVKLGPGRSAVSVAAGGTHACVVLDNDKVKCWGGNAAGRLGLGDTEARGDEPGEMGNQLPTVALGSGYQADAVTTGDAHTCVRLVGGALRCWGEGDFGRLGAGDTQDRGNGVTPIATVVEYEPPANDNRSAASSLTEASGLLGPVSTIGATEEPGEPDHGGEPGGSSVWYRFTAAGNGRAFFDTSASDYDTASAAYAFDGGAYTPVASAVFPTETMTFDMVAGKDYRIAIDGMDGDSGLLRFDYDLALPRPDVILRRGTGAPTGGNVYTPGVNIAQQSLRAFVRRNGTVVFSITLQNDAVFSDRLRVTGQGSTTRYAVTYRSASGANITSSVTRGSYQTPMLPSGGSQVIRLEVRALGTTPRDAVVARIVTARSTLQTTRSDSVKAIVRRE